MSRFGSPGVTHLEPEVRWLGWRNGELSCCAMPGLEVRQRATLLSELTNINKGGPALRHPAGTIRKRSDYHM